MEDKSPSRLEAALIKQKELEYSNFVCEHRAKVRLVWLDVQEILRPVLAEFPGMREEIERRIGQHDLDKFNQEIFHSYRQMNMPYEGEVIDTEAYAKARYIHTHNNKHHYEHWQNPDGSYREVEDWNDRMCAMIEMLCDWASASEMNHRSALFWWKTRYDKIYVDPYFDPLIEFVLTRLETILWERERPVGWEIYNHYD